MKIKVFMVDDHKMVREGFRLLLETDPDIVVLGEAGNGRDAVKKVIKESPDVVLMDIAMKGLNGIGATEQIVKECPTIKVIILSMHSSSLHIFRAFKAGAMGYILKESAGEDVIKAIHMVKNGRMFLGEKVSRLMVQDYVKTREIKDIDDPLARLSPREREILQLLVEGNSNSEIAEILYLSPKTIETYRSHLLKKLGISDLPGLVKFAIQQGLTAIE
jgi:RNA polymerase sigma factor (sigma-70 family)